MKELSVLRFILMIIVISLVFVSSDDQEVRSNTETMRHRPTNFIFVVFDDLRPDLSIYGGKGILITPNFERLAKRSVTFDYAFSQVAVCNPSRDSLLTGLRPDVMGHYGKSGLLYALSQTSTVVYYSL